jgi:hypothetical protein
LITFREQKHACFENRGVQPNFPFPEGKHAISHRRRVGWRGGLEVAIQFCEGREPKVESNLAVQMTKPLGGVEIENWRVEVRHRLSAGNWSLMMQLDMALPDIAPIADRDPEDCPLPLRMWRRYFQPACDQTICNDL